MANLPRKNKYYSITNERHRKSVASTTNIADSSVRSSRTGDGFPARVKLKEEPLYGSVSQVLEQTGMSLRGYSDVSVGRSMPSNFHKTYHTRKRSKSGAESAAFTHKIDIRDAGDIASKRMSSCVSADCEDQVVFSCKDQAMLNQNEDSEDQAVFSSDDLAVFSSEDQATFSQNEDVGSEELKESCGPGDGIGSGAKAENKWMWDRPTVIGLVLYVGLRLCYEAWYGQSELFFDVDEHTDNFTNVG